MQEKKSQHFNLRISTILDQISSKVNVCVFCFLILQKYTSTFIIHYKIVPTIDELQRIGKYLRPPRASLLFLGSNIAHIFSIIYFPSSTRPTYFFSYNVIVTLYPYPMTQELSQKLYVRSDGQNTPSKIRRVCHRNFRGRWDEREISW